MKKDKRLIIAVAIALLMIIVAAIPIDAFASDTSYEVSRLEITHKHEGGKTANDKCYTVFNYSSGHGTGNWWYTDSISSHDYSYLSCGKSAHSHGSGCYTAYYSCNNSPKNSGWKSGTKSPCYSCNGRGTWTTNGKRYSCGTCGGSGSITSAGYYTTHTHTNGCLSSKLTCTTSEHSHGGSCYRTGNDGHNSTCPKHVCSFGSTNCGYYSLGCGLTESDQIGTLVIKRDGINLIAELLGDKVILESFNWSLESTDKSITGITTIDGNDKAIIRMPDAGLYTCEVLYKDAYSKVTHKKSLTYDCLKYFEAVSNETDWTNEDLVITWNDIGEEEVEIKKDGVIVASFGRETFSYTVSENGTYEVTDKTHNITSKVFISKIDKEVPKVLLVTYSDLLPAKKVTVLVEAKAGISSIKSYRYIDEDGNVSSWQDSNEFILPKTGVYHFEVKSNAGSINEPYTDNVKIYVDYNAPVVEGINYTKDGVMYVKEEEFNFDLTDDYSLMSYVIKNSSMEVMAAELFFDVKTQGAADFAPRKRTQNVKVSKNDTYTLLVTDIAGNSTEKSFSIGTIDSTSPTINSLKTSGDEEKEEYKLKVSDDIKLKKIEVYLNGNLMKILSADGVMDERSITLTSNGTYLCKVYDEAGNTEETSFTVTGIVKTYTLDEEAVLVHTHAGIDNQFSPDGCFKEPYQSYELVGHHEEERDSKVTIGYCNECGKPAWDRCTCNAGFDIKTEVGKQNITVSDYGYKQRYTCTRLNESLGSVTLRKVLNDNYYLEIEDNTKDNSQIVSYLWEGRDTDSLETSFPSIHPNGGEASSISGMTDSKVLIPDFGFYSCTVTYKDLISSAVFKIRFEYMVEDYDLEPPTINALTLDVYDWISGDVVLSIDATDNFSVTGYEVSLFPNLTKDDVLKKDNHFTIEHSGLYYVYARDAIGNMSVETINITNIDKEGPEAGKAKIYIDVNDNKYLLTENGEGYYTYDAKNKRFVTVEYDIVDAIKILINEQE